MGLSSNQARFLSLTARQVDLEQRVQQICQRRLRLASELERVATEYNNSISNRKMFTFNTQNSGVSDLSVASLKSLGLRVVNNATNKILGENFMKKINQISESEAIAAGYTTIHDATELKNLINADLNGKYMLMGDIDMSSLGTLTNSLITGTFAGTFDGNGYDIRNLKIDTSTVIPSSASSLDSIGLFASNAGTIKNIGLENINIKNNITDHDPGSPIDTTNRYTGPIVGINGGTLSNCYVSNAVINGYDRVGGIAGTNNSLIEDCTSNATVIGYQYVGGVSGNNWKSSSGADIERCYFDGTATGTNYVGGIAGASGNASIINDSYSSGTITGVGVGAQDAGGIVGYNNGGSVVKDSYSTALVSSSGTNIGGVVGINNSAGYELNTFFKNPAVSNDGTGGTAVNGNINPFPTGSWTSGWDLSGSLPVLKKTSSDFESGALEENLRNGIYSIVKLSDSNTQSPLEIGDESYEKIDWRTLPQISDELYKSDDADAENKYDTTVANINSQDKKLQLEQSSVEVEYKAVASEKEAVKKILDTNATSSFKYFS